MLCQKNHQSRFGCAPLNNVELHIIRGSCENCVREFQSFTRDLYALADWLTECKVETVVMESTGIYWIPLFEILESRGF